MWKPGTCWNRIFLVAPLHGDDIETLMRKIDLDGDSRASRAEIMKFLKRLHTAEDNVARDRPLTTEIVGEQVKQAYSSIVDADSD